MDLYIMAMVFAPAPVKHYNLLQCKMLGQIASIQNFSFAAQIIIDKFDFRYNIKEKKTNHLL